MDATRDPARYLALAVIQRAVNDMRRHGAKNRAAPTKEEHLDAIVWLGAAHAVKWFDVAAVDRYDVLEATGWHGYAQRALKRFKMRPEEARVLREGCKVFASWEASRSQGF